jgi:hypothetical protein
MLRMLEATIKPNFIFNNKSRARKLNALAPLTEPHLLPPQWPRLKLEGVRKAR